MPTYRRWMTRALASLFDLSGKVAIVTGGSRGLGLQIVEAMGEYGASVALVARKRVELDQAVDHLLAAGITAAGFDADLSRPDAAPALVERVLDRFGRIDILINNAGTTWGAAAEDYPLDSWRKVIDLSLTGGFVLSQAVAKRALLLHEHGVNVNVASVEGLLGHHHNRIGTIAYNAAKGGVVNMTRALAAEWGPRGIRVNALAPGFFPSKMTAATVAEHGAAIIAQTPLGRLGGEQDLKGPALLLASDAGRHITGQMLVVDGGMTII